MDEIINRLTENGSYANEVCLLLLLENMEPHLEYLDKIKIRGEKLETFANKCCHDSNPSYIADTLLCISLDLFDLDIVHKNLESSTPLPFIDELYLPTDTHVGRFIRLKNEFDNKFIHNKSR